MEKFYSLTQLEVVLWMLIGLGLIYLISVSVRYLHKAPKVYKIDNVPHIEFTAPGGKPTLKTRINFDHLMIKDDRYIYMNQKKGNE
jgi:hypothetical protein